MDQKVTYEAQGWYKTANEDSWENGEMEGWTSAEGGERFYADTVDELVNKLMDFANVEDVGNVAVWPDEPGRIDISQEETDEGYIPTPDEMEAWKRGDINLYYATYTFYVERVTRERIVPDIPALKPPNRTGGTMTTSNITPLPWYGEGRLICGAGYMPILEVSYAPGFETGFANRDYAIRAANAYPKLIEALEQAEELVKIARQYFPKSMHNSDKFSLECTCATIGTALTKARE